MTAYKTITGSLYYPSNTAGYSLKDIQRKFDLPQYYYEKLWWFCKSIFVFYFDSLLLQIFTPQRRDIKTHTHTKKTLLKRSIFFTWLVSISLLCLVWGLFYYNLTLWETKRFSNCDLPNVSSNLRVPVQQLPVFSSPLVWEIFTVHASNSVHVWLINPHQTIALSFPETCVTLSILDMNI